MIFPTLQSVREAFQKKFGKPVASVANNKADAVQAALEEENIIENPTMSDFENLAVGDVLISSRPGSQREVIARYPDKKQFPVKVTRNSLLAGKSLPTFFRAVGDTIPMSKQELVDLPPNTQVFARKSAGVYVAITLHSATLGKSYDDRISGEYSYEDKLDYSDPDIVKVAVKIIKKGKKA